MMAFPDPFYHDREKKEYVKCSRCPRVLVLGSKRGPFKIATGELLCSTCYTSNIIKGMEVKSNEQASK